MKAYIKLIFVIRINRTLHKVCCNFHGKYNRDVKQAELVFFFTLQKVAIISLKKLDVIFLSLSS